MNKIKSTLLMLIACSTAFFIGCGLAALAWNAVPLKNASHSALVELIPEIKAGVVHIRCPEWQGSGFAVTPNLILTARHVVERVHDFKITTDDGHVLHATRAMSSKDHDIGFIYIDDLTCVSEKCEVKYDSYTNFVRGKHKVVLKPVELASISECRLGQSIITIGSAYGEININSVTLGVLSGTGRNYDPAGSDYGWSVAFQTDSPGHPGNSGGPVFSMDGKCRGVLVGGFSPSLIIVMPCDLILSDIDAVNAFFTLDKYQSELDRVEEAPYYNYRDDNEYYRLEGD